MIFWANRIGSWNTSHKIFDKIVDVLYRYRDALQEEIDDIQHIYNALKGLELDILQAAEADLDIGEAVQEIRQRFSKEKLQQYLAQLKNVGGRMLGAAAAIMGSTEVPALEIDTRYQARKAQKEAAAEKERARIKKEKSQQRKKARERALKLQEWLQIMALAMPWPKMRMAIRYCI